MNPCFLPSPLLMRCGLAFSQRAKGNRQKATGQKIRIKTKAQLATGKS